MNFPKQVKTRSVVILLSCLLVLSSVSMYYAFSASTPTSGLTDIYIEPPMMESSYIIGFYTAPTTCYLKNGTTGQIVSTGNFYSCMQGAINALTTGGKIFLRAGKYNLTAALVMWQEGIWIEGEGTGVDQKGTVIYDDITYTGVSTCMIYFTELAGTTHHFVGGMSNVFLQGRNRADIDGIVIHGYWSDLYFDKVIVLNFEDGIVLNGTGKVYAGESKLWNIFITDCLIENNVKYGIYFTGTSSVQTMIDRIKISNCHFYNNRNDIYCDTQFVYHISFIDNTVEKTAQACINVTSGGRQWIISDNHIFDCGIGANGTMAGIMVNGTGTFYPDSWLIENNIIANHFTSAPVAMNNSIWLTGTVTNFVIQGNFFFQASEPIRIDGLSSYSSIKVNGNKDYANNLVFPSENRPYSYLIGTFKSSYYMLNCSTGYVDYQSTNASKVINYAIGNLTEGGTVNVKSATYTLDAMINMVSNVTLMLEENTILKQTKSSWATYSGTINFKGTSGVPLKNAHVISPGHSRIVGEGTAADEHGALFMYASDCSLQGFEMSNFGLQAIWLAIVNNTLLRDLYIHKYAQNTLTSAIVSYGMLRCTFDHIDIDGFENIPGAGGGGILLNPTSWGSDILSNTFSNCHFQNTSSHGIYFGGSIEGGIDCRVAYNTVVNCIAQNMVDLVHVNSGQYNSIQGSAYNCTNGFQLGGQVGSSSIGNYVNVVVTNAYMGCHVFLAATNGNISQNIIFLLCENVTIGMMIEKVESPTNTFFSKNEIHLTLRGDSFINPTYSYGVSFSSTLASGIEANYNDFYCQIEALTYGIYWQSDYGRHNHFYGNIHGNVADFYNVSVSGTASYTCINNYGNFTGNIIASDWRIGDTIYNGTLWVISQSGVLTQINVGLQSAGAQLSSINGTAISHGMGYTPTSVTLTMYGQNSINSTCWYLPPTVYSMNATHIVICFTIFNAGTITAVAAPDSRTIYWVAVYKP